MSDPLEQGLKPLWVDQCRCWESNLGPLQSAEPSLQPGQEHLKPFLLADKSVKSMKKMHWDILTPMMAKSETLGASMYVFHYLISLLGTYYNESFETQRLHESYMQKFSYGIIIFLQSNVGAEMLYWTVWILKYKGSVVEISKQRHKKRTKMTWLLECVPQAFRGSSHFKRMGYGM